MKHPKCSLKVLSDNNELISGTAAVLHFLKQQGGWDKYIEEVTKEATSIAVDYVFKEMDKAKFKVV